MNQIQVGKLLKRKPMKTTFKAQLKLQFEDLEFNDFSDAVQDEFGVVNINTMIQFAKKDWVYHTLRLKN